jgi:hypothetical protein
MFLCGVLRCYKRGTRPVVQVKYKMLNPPIPDVLENTSWPLISGSPADVYPSSAMLCFRSYFKWLLSI